MAEKELTIRNRAGMHARPAALLVQTANRFKSRIYLEKDGEQVNAKSIMGILTLGATYNTVLKVIAEGEDADQAIGALEDLFERKFEES